MKDEFDWIKSITPHESHQKALIQGIGDDAALWSPEENMNQVISVDTMVENVHFAEHTMDPFHIGFKALASNFSDLAAMGAKPQYYLVSAAIPPHWSEDKLSSVYKGMKALGDVYRADLIGGDTVSTKGLFVLSITVIGAVEKERKLLRQNAKPGDIIFVTGNLGDSAAGLYLLLERKKTADFTESERRLVHAHQQPFPQVEAGRILAQSHFRIALNDISDGIASEANEIAEASGVEMELDFERLPKSKDLLSYSKEQQVQWMLFGGEDYQLVGTVAEEHVEELQQQFHQKNLSFIPVGRVVSANTSAVYLWKDGIRSVLLKQGYNHFNQNGGERDQNV